MIERGIATMKKMKKLSFALMALCLTALLVACGGAPSDPTPDASGSPAAPEASAPTAAKTYVFEVSGTQIAIDQNMAEVLAVLGEPAAYFETASCAFAGLDKMYTYSGFTITTRPEEEEDFVTSILLTDDSVTTPEGVYIGSTVADVMAAYGEAEAANGVIKYTLGGTVINFVLSGESVISIEYLPAA